MEHHVHLLHLAERELIPHRMGHVPGVVWGTRQRPRELRERRIYPLRVAYIRIIDLVVGL